MPTPKPSMARYTTRKGLPGDPAETRSVAEAVARLTRIATVAYGDYALPHVGQGALGIENDVIFASVIGHVYRERQSLQERWSAYRVDYERVTATVAGGAQDWLPKALASNRESLARFEQALAIEESLAKLRRAALGFEDFVQRRQELYVDFNEKPGGGHRRVENALARLQVEREAIDHVDDRQLRILFGHPDYRTLFHDLAAGDAQARKALAQMFRDAQDAIVTFGSELRADKERFWRYPPIVLAGFAASNVRAHAVFARYLLDVARLRAREWWELPLSVAGTAVAAVGLVATGGWGVVVLGVLDLGISGFGAVTAYLDARENEVAKRAATFGQVLTDRPTSYGPVALQAAAAIISGVQIAAGALTVFHEARAAREAAKGAADKLPAGAALDTGTARSEIRGSGVEREPDTSQWLEPHTHIRVGDVKSRKPRGFERPKGGKAAEGFVTDVEPLDVAAPGEAELSGTQKPDWLEPTALPRGRQPRSRGVTRDTQLEGIDPRVIGARRASTDGFLRDALEKISQPSHPLHFLVEPILGPDGKVVIGSNGKPQFTWRATTRIEASGKVQRGRYPGSNEGPIVQVGHQGAFASGTEERFMLEDVEFNLAGGAQIENRGGFSAKPAVEIDGVLVDLRTAQQWERLVNRSTGVPYLKPGTVARSPLIEPPPITLLK